MRQYSGKCRGSSFSSDEAPPTERQGPGKKHPLERHLKGDILNRDIWKWDVTVKLHSKSQFSVPFLRQFHMESAGKAPSRQHRALETAILRCLGLRCSGLRFPYLRKELWEAGRGGGSRLHSHIRTHFVLWRRTKASLMNCRRQHPPARLKSAQG